MVDDNESMDQEHVNYQSESGPTRPGRQFDFIVQ